MTLQECYASFEGDYQGTLSRLMKESLIERLLQKFLQDPSMPALKEAMNQKDPEGVFNAIHTLKGTALNLGFSKLAKASSDLTEKVRGGDLSDTADLYATVIDCYQEVLAAIQKMKEQ